MIEHTITATREELIAELERVKAQRDKLVDASNSMIEAWAMNDKRLGVVPSSVQKVISTEKEWRGTIRQIEASK